MAKAVRWIVPFQSLKGIQYEVRIYDNYTGTVPTSWPITLQGGATPFETSEDNSEDFFEPVRPSTGTLEVVDMDGTLMEQMLPKNNVSRPVVVIKDPSAPHVEFNGFLNCEAYSQDYNGATQSLSMNINGVLAAMESIEFDTSFIGHKKIREIIASVIAKVESVAGINIYDSVYISATARKAMEKMLDTSSFFEINEQSGENTTTYDICGISCKEVLDRICTFMGWTLREYANALYFQRVTDEYQMARTSVSNLSAASEAAFEQGLYKININEINMSALTYSGNDHKKEVRQGAKSVEVKVNLNDYETDCELPQDFPYGSTDVGNRPIYIGDDQSRKSYRMYALRDTDFNNKCDFRFFHLDEGNYEVPIIIEEGDVDDVFNRSHPMGLIGVTWHEYVGVMMSNMVEIADSEPSHETGLFVCAIPHGSTYLRLYNQDATRYIMRMRCLLPLCVDRGTITIDPKAILLSHDPDESISYGSDMENGDYIQLVLKWGNKYLKNVADEFEWVTTYSVVTLTKGDQKIQIPVTEYNAGVFEVYIHPYCAYQAATNSYPAEYILQSLNLQYVPEGSIYDDKSSNVYFRFVNMQFSEKESISTDIASNLGNSNSPSHIWNTPEVMATTIGYIRGMDGYILQDMRPEVDLLSRMAWHYAKSRRLINLEVMGLTTALPLVWIRNDYEDASRLYSPLAVERNYQEDTTTLTCMEIPDRDEWVF